MYWVMFIVAFIISFGFGAFRFLKQIRESIPMNALDFRVAMNPTPTDGEN